MASMTKHPTSPVLVPTIPTGIYPRIASPTPWSIPVGVVSTVKVKCRNVHPNASCQLDGVDSANAQWFSPSTVLITLTPGAAHVYQVTVTSPEGLVSNASSFAAVTK